MDSISFLFYQTVLVRLQPFLHSCCRSSRTKLVMVCVELSATINNTSCQCGISWRLLSSSFNVCRLFIFHETARFVESPPHDEHLTADKGFGTGQSFLHHISTFCCTSPAKQELLFKFIRSPWLQQTSTYIIEQRDVHHWWRPCRETWCLHLSNQYWTCTEQLDWQLGISSMANLILKWLACCENNLHTTWTSTALSHWSGPSTYTVNCAN